MKPALLVIDMQQQFFGDPVTAKSLNDAIETINAAIALFRKKGLPIAAIQHIDPADHLVPGEAGFDLPDSLCLEPSDLRIHKTYGNAFNKTSLEADLRRQGVDTVIVTGYCAEFCVLSTYRGAEDRDFTAILLRDALASAYPHHIPFIETINEVVTYGALEKLIENI